MFKQIKNYLLSKLKDIDYKTVVCILSVLVLVLATMVVYYSYTYDKFNKKLIKLELENAKIVNELREIDLNVRQSKLEYKEALNSIIEIQSNLTEDLKKAEEVIPIEIKGTDNEISNSFNLLIEYSKYK